MDLYYNIYIYIVLLLPRTVCLQMNILCNFYYTLEKCYLLNPDTLLPHDPVVHI